MHIERTSNLACEDVPPATLGDKLHRKVPPDYWCVTKEDLRRLKADICTALENSELRPNSHDQFDPEDREIGPNMYTVVQDYIKPVTASRGCMSWALMMHPDGLECDIFVTHAWHEGVFELIDKVLTGWPSSKRHAYICALANPQNLDIGDLISCPQESPFAKALMSCSHILVVPNRKVSIYSRLWCVYEAFLGYSLEKVILVSRRPWYHKVVWSCLELLPALIVGLLMALFRELSFAQHKHLAFINYLFVTCTILLDARQLKRLIIHIAVGFTAFTAAYRLNYCLSCYEYNAYPSIFHCVGFWGGLILVLNCGAIDVVACEELDFEASELTHEFSGDVRDAQCSMDKDRIAILDEIGGRMGAVNQTVSVLLDAGMSTSELRLLASQGYRIQHAGYINLGLTSAGFLTWLRLGLVWHYFHLDQAGTPQFSKRQLFLITFCIGWSAIWFFSEQDRRAFASAAVGRIFFVADNIFTLGACFYSNYHTMIVENESFYGIMMATAGAITFFISAAGPARLTRVPRVGTLLVRYLMTKRLYKCCKSLFGHAQSRQSFRAVELTDFSMSSQSAHSVASRP